MVVDILLVIACIVALIYVWRVMDGDISFHFLTIGLTLALVLEICVIILKLIGAMV